MHQSAVPAATEKESSERRTCQKESAKTDGRGRPRSGEAEDAILAATLKLLVAKPLRDITMEEIARKAGVGKATIYKWWPNKAHVALDAFLRETNQMVPIPDTGSVKQDIQEQLRALIHFYLSPTGTIMAQFLAESQSDAEFGALFRKHFLRPRREYVGVMFDRGIERGEIDPALDRELVLDMIYGPAIYRLAVGHSPLSDEVADGIVSILFGGIDRRQSKSSRATKVRSKNIRAAAKATKEPIPSREGPDHSRLHA